MDIGVNLNWTSDYEPMQYWSNLVRNVPSWDKVKGGTRGSMANILDITQGKYYLRWEGEGQVSVGTWSNPERYCPKTTEGTEQFCIRLPRGEEPSAICVWWHGPLQPKSISVVSQKNASRFVSGQSWDVDYIEYLRRLNVKSLRFMNLTQVNIDYSETYGDLTTEDSLSYKHGCPVKVMAELCNEVSASAWFNVSTRLNEEGIERQALEWSRYLRGDLRLYVEYSNEMWNYMAPFSDNQAWVRNLKAAKVDARVEGGELYSSDHGLRTGDAVCMLQHKANKDHSRTGDWRSGMGIRCTVARIDNSRFSISREGKVVDDFGEKKVVKYCKIDDRQPDKWASNLVDQCEMVSDIYKRVAFRNGNTSVVLPSQASNIPLTKAISRETELRGITNKFSSLAIAPYLKTSWWGVRVEVKNGDVRVFTWTNKEVDIYMGGHPEHQKVSKADILRMRGSALNMKYEGKSSGKIYYDRGIVGIVKKQSSYQLSFVLRDKESVDTRIDVLIGKDGIYYGFDSFRNQMNKEMDETEDLKSLCLRQAAQSGLPLTAYEGGYHYQEEAPSQVREWLNTYHESVEGIMSARYYLQKMKESGIQVFNWYKDQSRSPFSLFHDKENLHSDGRYIATSTYSDITATPRMSGGVKRGSLIRRPNLSNVWSLSKDETMRQPYEDLGSYVIRPAANVKWPSIVVNGLFDRVPANHTIKVYYDAMNAPLRGADGMEIMLTDPSGKLRRIEAPVALVSDDFIRYTQVAKNDSEGEMDVGMMLRYNNISDINTFLRIDRITYRIIDDNI